MTMSLQCNTVSIPVSPPKGFKMILKYFMKIEYHVNASIHVQKTCIWNTLHIKKGHTHDNRMNMDIKN